MARLTDRPAMTIAVDLGRKATKPTNVRLNCVFLMRYMVVFLLSAFSKQSIL